jgi:hypothetical protein
VLSCLKPERDDESDFHEIASRRKPPTRDLLYEAELNVSQAYANYRTTFDSYRTPMPAGGPLKNALYSNYDFMDAGRPMQAIRDDLLAAAKGLCPLCGCGPVGSLDHFLPRTTFPELSVLSLNLVPCCVRCNTKKLERHGRAGEPRFLHAYFDLLPDDEVLVASVHIDISVTTSFAVHRTPKTSLSMYGNVSHHFDKLQLDSYFQDESNLELFNRLDAMHTYFELGSDVLRNYLEVEHQSLLANLGCNYWKTALYATLSRNRDFWEGGFRTLG